MRLRLLALAVALLCDAVPRSGSRSPAPSEPAAPAARRSMPVAATAPVDSARDVRPVLQAHCQPCHFAGGSRVARLPFDRPQTIDRLGTKLFTRIKSEDTRRLIRAFLARGR